MGALTESPKVYFDAFSVDLRAGEVYKHGIRLKLQGQPFRVLAFLLERPGDIVAREELRQRLWPADTFVDFDTGLNSAIKKLRDVLGDSAGRPHYIETLPRRGYRFIGTLDGAAGPSPQSALQIADDKQAAKPSPLLPKTGGEAPRGRFRLVLALALVVATLTLAAVLAFAPHGRSGSPQDPIKSLAVLPLQNLSGDPAQDYFADGMTEEVIGRLSMIRGLRVVSRTSIMQFKDTRPPAPVIARELGVDALVEGSVIRAGGRVRVHAQLIRAVTDEHFWSETYDRELGDALALESEVAQAIAAKVQVTVTGEERERLVAARRVAPEVYESYLKGQSVQGNSRADFEKSLAFFEDAIHRDPTFAPAYVGVAAAYNSLGTVFVGLPPQETRPKLIRAARKALELDPSLAEAHVLLATVYQRQWQWTDAEAEFKRALEIKPNDAKAHLGLANWLMCQDRLDEALTWARRARELEPLAVNGYSLAWILYSTRQYDEAIRELRSDLAVHPDQAIAHWFLGFVLIDNGHPEQAVPELEKTVSLMNRSPGAIGVLIRAYAKAGRRSDALRMLAELQKRRESDYVPAGAFINAYLGLEDYDQTFVWLEKAYQEQSNIMQFLKVHPFFDPIRDDPRFKSLVRRVGLPSST
jgi:pentatricopeptide repeat protein